MKNKSRGKGPRWPTTSVVGHLGAEPPVRTGVLKRLAGLARKQTHMRNVKIKICYSLCNEVHKKLNLESDTPVSAHHEVQVSIPLDEALERRAAHIDASGEVTVYKQDLIRYEAGINYHHLIPQAKAVSLEPDHILSAEEALALWRAEPAQRELAQAEVVPEIEAIKEERAAEAQKKKEAQEEVVRRRKVLEDEAMTTARPPCRQDRSSCGCRAFGMTCSSHP